MADADDPIRLAIDKSLERAGQTNNQSLFHDSGGQRGIRGKISEYDHVWLTTKLGQQKRRDRQSGRRRNTTDHIESAGEQTGEQNGQGVGKIMRKTQRQIACATRHKMPNASKVDAVDALALI